MLNFGGVRVFLVDSCTYSNVLRPCQCKGSIEYVHLGCLRHWVSSPRWTNTLVVSNSKNFPMPPWDFSIIDPRSKGVSILQTLQRDPTSTGHWLSLKGDLDLINFVLLCSGRCLVNCARPRIITSKFEYNWNCCICQRVTAVSERLVWFLSCQTAYPANVSKGGFLKLIITLECGVPIGV